MAKRAVDMVVGVIACIVAIPFILALAVVLAVHLRSWPFFVHERIGTNGRRIRFPKLRTLPAHTPPYANKTTTPLEVSRFCRLLRRAHVDELPQLFLVPVGAMSLVGPRPRMLSELDDVPDPVFDELRITVRQGCTGLWQVGQHCSKTVSDSPEYDLFYLANGSLRMDAWILWRTFRQLFGGAGAAIEDVPRWTHGRGFGILHTRRSPADAEPPVDLREPASALHISA